MRQTPELRVELLSKPAYLCGVRELVGGVAQRLGFSCTQAHHVVLAVDEALANVMVHGYERREDGRISMAIYRLDENGAVPGIKIVIEDEGKTVDPTTIKSRDLADIRPGGLGVHIIRQMMDEVRYEPREPRGMRLVLIKHASSQPAGGEAGPVSQCECR